jgi:hypothetical protein
LTEAMTYISASAAWRGKTRLPSFAVVAAMGVHNFISSAVAAAGGCAGKHIRVQVIARLLRNGQYHHSLKVVVAVHAIKSSLCYGNTS